MEQGTAETSLGTEKMESLLSEHGSILEMAGKAKMQAASEFLADVRKMINNADCSDVVFLCQDGESVYASRLLLVARSPVLKCMLMNGMVESRLSEIPLPHISSTALLSVMEFLYSGNLEEHAPKNWRKAFEILSAARFFLLQNLEVIVLEYLLDATNEVESDMTAAAKFLSVAVEFTTLCDSVDVIPRELVKILNSRCLEPSHFKALTDRAFRYFLQKTRNELADPNFLSLDEYLRFRQVIMWSVCQLWPDVAEEVVKSCMPDMKSSLLMLKGPVRIEIAWPGQPQVVWRKEDLARYVSNMICMIDLRRVHPELLIKVIEPMEVVSASGMMEALRFHALRRSRRVEKKTHEWHFRGTKSADIYSVCRDGSVIEQIGHGRGFVRYTIAINRPYGVFEWDIVIEKVCDLFCEVGIHHEAKKPFLDGRSLAEQPGGWALRMDAGGIYVNRRGIHRIQQGDPGFASYGKDCSQKAYGKDFGQKNGKVRVHLDMFERTCSFSVDCESFGVAWSNLPDGTYYPAISLGGGSGGKARIQLISGFDLL